jgi:hypothetical protein
MTVTSELNTVSHVANGIQVIFPYNFRIDTEEEAKVYFADILQVSGYIIDGIGDVNGGNVTFDVAPLNEVVVTIQREVPFTQLTVYPPYGPFPAEQNENSLDKVTFGLQQLSSIISRAIIAPIGADPGVDYTMPLYDAGKAIMWSESDPKEIVNSDDNLNGIISGSQANADAAAASAASASGSAGSAAGSATDSSNSAIAALASEDKAEQWAQNPEDVPVEPDEFSALHWAKKSEDAARTQYDIPWFAGMGNTWVGVDVEAKVYGRLLLGRDMKIEGAIGSIDVPPTGSILGMKITVDGVNIFSVNAFFDDTTGVFTPGVLVDPEQIFPAGSDLAFEVTTVGVTTPGQGVMFTINGGTV